MGRFTDNLRPLHTGRETGMTAKELDRDLKEVAAETRQRKNRGLDTEDQDVRAANLRAARGRIN